MKLAPFLPWRINYLPIYVVLAIVIAVLLMVFGYPQDAPALQTEVDYRADEVVFDYPLSSEFNSPVQQYLSTSPISLSPHPQLEIPQTDVTLTYEDAEWRYSHTFVVRNTGVDVLHITGLTTSCPCLHAYLTSSVIPPGRVALLQVHLDLLNDMIGFSSTDGVRFGIFLQTNDPAWPQASIWVEAVPPN